jgi:predicted  nucleic acid-binding Zn-ribbon protein
MTEDVTVAVDGVTVTKSYEAERFPVPAIAFEVDSGRDEGVALRVTDDVPESFPMDRIGFHPDYESDSWTAYQDNRVRYERTLDGGEAVTTVYGIRLEDDEDPGMFLGEPTVEVTPLDEVEEGAEDRGDEAAVEDIVPSETTEVVREALADDEPVPGLDVDGEASVGPTDDDSDLGVADVAVSGDDEPGDATDDAASTAVADEPAVAPAEPDAGSDDADEPADAADAPDAADTASASDADRSVAAALADEIRAGDVADDDLAALREALAAADDGDSVADDTAEGRRSVEVRLDHVQGRVSDLEAYVDALESFIDGEGTARDVLEGVRDDLEAVESRTDALERDLEAVDREVEALRDEFDDVAGDLDAVDAVEADVERLAADLDALDERLADVEDADDHVADVREDVADLEDDIAEIREWRDQLTDVFGG